MIVTRRWLEEYISLEGVSDEALHDTFNSIGLEVDSMRRYRMPKKVVVGRIISCKKHPNADKLNLCTVDVGRAEPLSIVCGAANVVSAEYVAVAMLGAILPGDLHIKEAKIRGVESFGMICSSSELGLPSMGDGIMILDDSIGKLVAGKELCEYPDLNDTVIELELTANRGDCLSVRGVARDLSAALDRALKPLGQFRYETMPQGIARIMELHTNSEIEADILYYYALKESLSLPLLTELRLAYVEAWSKSPLKSHLNYATHAAGVVLRAYDAIRLRGDDAKIYLELEERSPGLIELRSGERVISFIGISASSEYLADDSSSELLIEASYIDPQRLVPAAANLEADDLYYRSSRGSEPDIGLGMRRIMAECSKDGECRFSTTPIRVETSYTKRTVAIDVKYLKSIIGQEISLGTIYSILRRLGFVIHGGDKERFGIVVPRWRHDIHNVQDVAEEILRIVGINKIEAKPLEFREANRLSQSARLFRIRRDLRQRAVAAGFYEAITYAFADRKKLETYGFDLIEESKELLNPIVDELNTLRSTLTINLLDVAQRNASYGKRRIALFEIGAVFDAKRQEREKLALLWSADAQEPSIANHGKAPRIDFSHFVQKLGSIVGDYELVECKEKNALIHPYQSATILVRNQEAGWLSRLHPIVAEAFDLEDTMIAELDFEALIPPHINTKSISNYQGTFKDLSLLVAKDMPYRVIKEALEEFDEPLLRRFFPIDIYEDEQLGERKSVTLRFFLQSDEATLSDKQIEGVMERILKIVQNRCEAELR